MSGSTSSNYIGSGSDTITLKMSEDQARGTDAEFTVNVDGQQIGDVQTVTAQRSAGQDESFTFAGNFAPGPHDVTVTFANNFIYPGLSGDRNVYVDGITYDGQTISSSTTPIYESPWFPPNANTNVYGNAVFSVNDTTAIPGGASTSSSTPGPVTVGSGSDTIVLNVAEDAYAGDAQFTVSVDGKQVGGLQTTTAIVGEGQAQEFDVKGNFGGGTHTVTVNFTNDAIGGYYPDGTPDLPPGQRWALDTEDRNLYVMGVSMDGGAPAQGTPWEQSSSGTFNYTVTAGSNPNATGAGSGLFATDGAPATSNNAAIPSSALSTSSMSFVAAPTTTTTTASASSATDSGSSTTPATTTTTPTVATVAAATPTTQDFTVPTSTASATDTTSSSGTSGSASTVPMAVAATTSTHTHHHHFQA